MITFLSVVILIGGYLIGSTPVGLLLVRATTGKDVREVGSGRTGGTNTLRAAGPWVALITMTLDAAKGFSAVMLARLVLNTQGVELPLIEAAAGLVAVIGHNHSIFIGFEGGAGTMTSGGGAIGLWPWNGIILLLLGGSSAAITSHASVGSITIALALPVIYALRAALGYGPWGHLLHGIGAAALSLWSLRPNIQRLMAGSERRIVLKSSHPQPQRAKVSQSRPPRRNIDR